MYVAPGSPGQKAGIRKGDELVSIAGVPVTAGRGRHGDPGAAGCLEEGRLQGARATASRFTANVIIGEAERDSTLFYQYAVGLVYLAIGLFVYFRRVGAPRSLHFFLLCLASFVLSTFHYSGKLNNFDKVIYLGNVVAGYLAPTLFLHFCCMFPEPQKWIRRRGMAALLYVPGTALLAMHLGFVYGMAGRRRRCSKCGGCWIAPGWGSCARCIWREARCWRCSCGTPTIRLCGGS